MLMVGGQAVAMTMMVISKPFRRIWLVRNMRTSF